MQSDGMAKQIAKWIALGALFLVPIMPLIVANGYFFPFITGKAFYFRILVEIAVAAWAVLALLDKEYRPRFSWVGAAVVAFVVWMFIADAFALNAAKAFWSNFERMEGWVMLIHLLGFFFAAGAVLRVGKKWRAWFLWSLIVSLYISGHALFQLAGWAPIHQGSTRIDASLGNSAYLAIYFLFNVFIALWLALTEKYSWLKWSLIALAVLEAILIFFTETRGTIVGLVLALALAALLTAVTAGKRARQGAALALALIVILAGSFYLARNSSFVQGNHVLQRVASISWADLQVRRTIWHMAFQGALERPIVGWGQEGFNYVFNTYYDPSLYHQEQWFDRAHNAFIDWLSAGGVPAFLLYLSLFGSAIVLLWRSSELSRPERIALTAALVGYAVHNLFVFDNLYSYVYFFALLALIDSQVARPLTQLENAPEITSTDGVTYALPIAVAVAGVLIWFVNVPGMQVATKLITALSPSPVGISGNLATFQELAAHPAFAAQEMREQLVSFAMSVVQSSQATDTEKQQAFSFAVSEMKKQIASYPLDARGHLELFYVYRAAGDSANALTEIQAAIALSPSKEGMWIEAGVTEWDAGNTKAAQADFNTAYQLGPQFTDLALYAAAGDIAAGDSAAADKVLMAAFGTTNVNSDILAAAYYRAKDWPHLIRIWKMRANKPDATVESWFSLAAAYYASGDRANAIATINTAVKLFPDAASAGASAIKQILQGK
ncbi:MAG: O-antigen ligase family protein [Candidatus Parcubacteria bacterium]|nr:O-antigen ligase family protein [Candidatus Parcubacteria bacterium]